MNYQSDNRDLCFLCRSKDVKKCKDCRNYVCNECILSQKAMSFVVKKHNKCVDCETEICCFKPICEKCDINPYHMITDKIALGSSSSKYDNFDIIVNVNYPENGVRENDIEVQKKNGKMIIKLGLSDSVLKDKEAYKYITEIIPILYKYYNDKNILFHCYAGMSRSSCFCVAYLSYIKKISIDEAHSLVKSKRKFIQINEGFMRSLSQFEKYIQGTL